MRFIFVVILLAISAVVRGFRSSSRASGSLFMSSTVASPPLPQLTTARPFLTTVLSSRSKITDKAALVQALQGLRASEAPSVPRTESRDAKSVWSDKASFLDLLLQEVDSTPALAKVLSSLPVLSRLPSHRVRMASLARVLTTVLSEQSENDGAAKVLLESAEPEIALVEYRSVRRRRALSVVLGQVSCVCWCAFCVRGCRIPAPAPL